MPKSQFSTLMRPDKVDSLSFVCPCAKERYRKLLTESWAVFDSNSSGSQKEKDAKRNIAMLSKRLITQMLNNTFEIHMGPCWRPCQDDEAGLITLSTANISNGIWSLILAQAEYIARQRTQRRLEKGSCTCRRCLNRDRQWLFELPAELRNEVYRLVLVSNRNLQVLPTWRQPNLLITNKKIRDEASSIFYLENNFYVPLRDFDCTPLLRFHENTAMRDHYGPGVQINYDMPNPAMNWQNLLRWIKLHFDGKFSYMTATRPGNLKLKAGARAFELTRKLKAERMKWPQVEDALVIVKDAMEEQANGAWKWV